MKLNPDYMTQEIDNYLFLVPVGNDNFKGIMKLNRTAAFIIDQLKEETSKESIITTMCDVFDAPKEIIAQDVENTLKKLMEIGAI